MHKITLHNLLLCLLIPSTMWLILFSGQNVGLADNGDFIRVMQPMGIGFISGHNAYNYISDYGITAYGNGILRTIYHVLFPAVTNKYGFITTQFLFIKAALLINTVIKALAGQNLNIFDIRYLGILYLAIYSTGLLLAVLNFRKSPVLKIAALFLSIFVFCDIEYLLYFNSFYGEALILSTLVLLLGLVHHIVSSGKTSLLPVILFYLAAFIYTGAKPANIPAGIVIALFGLALLLLRRDIKAILTVCSLSLALLIFTIHMSSSTPVWMEKANLYNTVFFGILRDSPTPGDDLEELGADRSLAVLKDTNFYSSRPQKISDSYLESHFYGKVSFSKAAVFYIKHPDRLLEKLRKSASFSTMIKPGYLGNYTSQDNTERLVFAKRFSFWSSIRKRTFDFAFELAICISVLFIAAVLFELIKSIRNRAHKNTVLSLAMISLWAIACIQFVIPIIGNGEADLGKHMFLYTMCQDLMLAAGVLWLSAKTVSLFKRRNVIVKYLLNIPARKMLMPISILILICSAGLLLSYLNGNAGGRRNIDTGVGSTIEFGSYLGEPLKWLIADRDREKGVLLISQDIVAMKPYDDANNTGDSNRVRFGSNLWIESAVRKWLNDSVTDNGFLKGFTKKELEMINTIKNKYILSSFDLHLKKEGKLDFYWSNIISNVSQNYATAYSAYTFDKVFLPDVEQLQNKIYRQGLEVVKAYNGKPACYWLETCYFGNSSMVRIVDTDGYVSHKDACADSIGVVPAMYIQNVLD